MEISHSKWRMVNVKRICHPHDVAFLPLPCHGQHEVSFAEKITTVRYCSNGIPSGASLSDLEESDEPPHLFEYPDFSFSPFSSQQASSKT